MADSLGTAVLELSTDNSKFDRGLDAGEAKAKGWVGIVGKALGGLAIGAGVLAGLRALGDFMVDSTKAAMEAQSIQTQLTAVLRSTGSAAGMTADAVNDLATALSQVTPFEDDAIVSGQNLLLTFTNIGRSVFPQATEAMLDMSQAMGTDMKSSAIQLGKASNDPVAGLSALTRVGVTFTEAQKNQIKQMVDWGNVAGAQKLILKELAKEFGGTARAAGGTLAGQLTILENQLGNVKEEIGTALIPALTQIIQQYGPEFIQVFRDLVPTLKDIAPAMIAIAKAVDVALKSITGLIWLIQDLIAYGTKVVGVMNQVKAAVNTALGLPQSIQLPGFAGGVRNFGGGMALVGERGPELTYLQPHTNVLPAQQTAALGGKGDVWNLDLRGSSLTEAQVYRQIDRALATRGQQSENRNRMK